MRFRTKLAATLAAATLSALLQGCGVGPAGETGAAVAPTPAVHMSGVVHGGQQPISGATIQLYAVNTTTTQGASAALIGSTVLSDANGNFNITNTYTCPTGAQVYIAAMGGNPGAGTNTSIALLAGLGPCSSLTASTFIWINEITTVATVYALAPFMADVAHVGAAPANLQGLINAFQTEQTLANTSNGSAPGPLLPANAAAPTTRILSLADIIASCINSVTGSTQCSSLFAATTTGATPTDTVQALLSIAHNPSNNPATIFTQLIPTSPFQPMLTAAPGDWSLQVNFSGGGLTYPFGLAVDASGNVWAANAGGFSVSEFNYLGAPVTAASGYTGGGLLAPQGLAVDLSGNVWVANTGATSVVKMSPTGVILSGSSGFTSGIGAATAIAIDKSGDAWVTSFDTNSLTELDTNGNALNGSPISTGTGSAPVSVSIDPASDVWVSNSGTGNVAKYSIAGIAASGSPFTDGWLQGGGQAATTSSGSPWVVGAGDNALSAFAVSGAPLPASPVAGGGLSSPDAIAVDGADTLWVANGTIAGTLSAFTSAGAALTSAAGIGALNTPSGIAVDASGNVWTANSGANSLSEFIGLAAPIVTPLAARIH